MGLTTGFRNSAGKDIGSDLVEKSYLIDRYPELADTFRFAGLWTWGHNNNGQMGDNTLVHRSSPIQTVSGGANWKEISAGSATTMAIKTDGTLWGWGSNQVGEIGANNNAHRSSPVQTISGGTNWKIVSAASAIVAAIKTDGTLWTWGQGVAGGLGYSSVVNRSSPGQTIAAGTNWKQVSVGGNSTVGSIKTDGTLWTWGRGDNGELGINAITHRSSPGQTIAGGTNWRQVSCGGQHLAAIKTDGTLWTWGHNGQGQLGVNDIAHRSSPVQTVAGGTNWKQVAAGGNSAGGNIVAAIKTDGTLWIWGRNTDGNLGDNTIVHRSSPVQTIAGGTNWKQVACGDYSTHAIKTNGTLWTWGHNDIAQLGTNDTVHRSSPVQTVTGGTNWKRVDGGRTHTAAIRDDSSDIFGDPM